jgi:hypothetical protein
MTKSPKRPAAGLPDEATLLAFLRETGHDPMIVDLPVPEDGQNA